MRNAPAADNECVEGESVLISQELVPGNLGRENRLGGGASGLL